MPHPGLSLVGPRWGMTVLLTDSIWLLPYWELKALRPCVSVRLYELPGLRSPDIPEYSQGWPSSYNCTDCSLLQCLLQELEWRPCEDTSCAFLRGCLIQSLRWTPALLDPLFDFCLCHKAFSLLLDLDVHADVHSLDCMGESTYADVIHAGGSHFLETLDAHVSRCLSWRISSW